MTNLGSLLITDSEGLIRALSASSPLDLEVEPRLLLGGVEYTETEPEPEESSKERKDNRKIGF
jgi:hypothetical protein